MKAKELADRLLQYPDFEVNFSFSERDNSSWGLTVRTFEDIHVSDIGHSDRRIILGGNEQ